MTEVYRKSNLNVYDEIKTSKLLINHSTLGAKLQAPVKLDLKSPMVGLKDHPTLSDIPDLRSAIESKASQSSFDLVSADVGVLQSGLATVNADIASLQTSETNLATQIAAESAQRTSDVSALQGQIDALGVTDVSTLAQINQIITDYQSADSSVATEQTQQNARLSALEATVAELTIGL